MLKQLLLFVMLLAVSITPAQAQSIKQQRDFIYAITFGRVEDVKLLLANGASPNQRDDQNWPALSVAASRSDPEAFNVVRALVEAGADVNAIDDKGNAPLMVAVKNNSPQIVDYLINKGANYHVKTKDGTTVLQAAKRTGNKKIIDTVESLINAELALDKQRRSPENRVRLLKDYLYYNCTYQYLAYNIEERLYLDKARTDEALEKQKLQSKKINETLRDMYNYFGIGPMDFHKTGKGARAAITEELNKLISNRFRRAKGVGKDADMDARCAKIADTRLAEALKRAKKLQH